jgi:MoaA/NifB/PqqE/SkfB family radical SAM enzyme
MIIEKTNNKNNLPNKSTSQQNWKQNIKLSTRIKVFIRNFFIKNINNPIQKFRRNNGLADQDIFKHVLIQTNYKCTRRCSFCHYGMENPPQNIDMDENLFYAIINQLGNINYSGRIGLFEMNEPLTDTRLNKFLKYTRNKLPMAWIFITSNGDLLNIQKTEQLFKNGLNFIYLDSYDEIALKRNLKLIEEITPKYKKLIHHMNRTYQIAWSSRAGNIKQFKKNIVFAPCDFVYDVLYIKPIGKVYSCYNDFYNINEMGDLNKNSILDVWFGSNFKKLRKELNKCNRNCSELCRQCDYIGYGNLPHIPLSWKFKKLSNK